MAKNRPAAAAQADTSEQLRPERIAAVLIAIARLEGWRNDFMYDPLLGRAMPMAEALEKLKAGGFTDGEISAGVRWHMGCGRVTIYSPPGPADNTRYLIEKPALVEWGWGVDAKNGRGKGRGDYVTLPPLTPGEMAILKALADEYPAAVTQYDLETATDVSRRTISPRLTYLESEGLIERPKGTKRKGHAITAAGLQAIGRSAPPAH